MTGIIILNYNNASDTINCIKSIEAYNTTPVKYIVVDNGSTKKEGIELLDHFFSTSFQGRYLSITDESPTRVLPTLTFLASPTNDGYAKGNNKGLALAYDDHEIDHILIINNDILFTEDIIPVLYDKVNELDHPGMVSPLLRKRDGKRTDHNCARLCPTSWEIILPLFWHNRRRKKINQFQERGLILMNHPEYAKLPFFPIELPSGSCMYARKKVFQDIGGFDNDTFLYFEENILFAKLSKFNYRNYCIPDVHATHLGAGSTSKTSSIFLQQCMVDSADYYLRTYGDLTIAQRFVWWITRKGWRLTFFMKEAVLKKS